jgi:hypothetical protein
MNHILYAKKEEYGIKYTMHPVAYVPRYMVCWIITEIITKRSQKLRYRHFSSRVLPCPKACYHPK